MREMDEYKVYFSGWYIVEADSLEEALETDQDDAIYAEWQNESAVVLEENEKDG